MLLTLLAGAFLCYPFAVYLLSNHWPQLALIALLAVLAGIRIVMLRNLGSAQRALALAALGVFCMLAWFGREWQLLKLYPALMSLGGALWFGATLLSPPSAAERLARAAGLTIDADAVGYTRGVTQLWTGFFIANTLFATYTALAMSEAFWALYNGLLSYLIIAVLFGAEYLFRRWYQRRLAQRQ